MYERRLSSINSCNQLTTYTADAYWEYINHSHAPNTHRATYPSHQLHTHTSITTIPCNKVHTRTSITTIPCHQVHTRTSITTIPCNQLHTRTSITTIPCNQVHTRTSITTIPCHQVHQSCIQRATVSVTAIYACNSLKSYCCLNSLCSTKFVFFVHAIFTISVRTI